MIISPQMWFKWAAHIMPPSRQDWLSAMEAELEQISGYTAQNIFAFGCFRAAMLEGARSRKGLSWLARIGGAFALFAFSAAIILWNTAQAPHPETLAFSKIITALAVAYMCGAGLLMTSLRGLKIYAGIGFGGALFGGPYLLILKPSYEYLPAEFLAALSLEAALAMATLFLSGVYLDWLYDPAIHDI